MIQKIWRVKNKNTEQCQAISQELGVNLITAHLLMNRGINTSYDGRRFFSADISDLHDPFLFKDMSKVVERINAARSNKERVLIFGDYDVDGVTSSALLYRALTDIGIDVINHIPHRVDEGYGLNDEIADFARSEGVTLLISVDCGITAFKEIDKINSYGIEVIVIDHHEPAPQGVPSAYAIIDPKCSNSGYPFRHLAAVGLVAKVIQALTGKIDDEALDLAAVGTVADIVPLIDENRIFVKYGLAQLCRTKNHGLAALLQSTKLNEKRITPFHIGFMLGPRINASGRMDSAHTSLDLFLSRSRSEADALAAELEQHNQDRQRMQREVVQEAIEIVEQEINFNKEKVIVLSKNGWHKGILGIVASKLTDRYYRPTVVISIKDGIGVASARSVEGFHLHNVLQTCAHHLEAFGGHEGAAGLTIREENIDPFRTMINKVAAEIMEEQEILPVIDIDAEMPLAMVDMNFVRMIEAMEPFGEGNPLPILCSRGLTVRGAPRVMAKDTLKFWVTDGKVCISAVGFGMGSYEPIVRQGKKLDLAYEVSIDDWNKEPTVQLMLKDIKVSE